MTCLCDTGSSIGCIDANVAGLANGTLLPTISHPVGANGTPLVNRDIYAKIEVHNTLHSERFTVIKDLCYDVILGVQLLQKMGFKLLNDAQAEISGKHVNCIIDDGGLKFIQTSIFALQ